MKPNLLFAQYLLSLVANIIDENNLDYCTQLIKVAEHAVDNDYNNAAEVVLSNENMICNHTITEYMNDWGKNWY